MEDYDYFFDIDSAYLPVTPPLLSNCIVLSSHTIVLFYPSIVLHVNISFLAVVTM